MNCREEGKLYFQKGKYSAAAEAYTEAITLEPSDAALYQNRALCYQKLCKWNQVLDDARKALELSKKSVKAQYLLATAFMNLNQLEEAEKAFQDALVLAALPEFSGYKESIEQGLYSMYHKRWEDEQSLAIGQDEKNKLIIDDLINEAYDLERAKEDSSGEVGAAERNRERRRAQLNEIYERVSEKRQESTIPESLCCQITFDLMRDPVLTPAGQTYESAALEQHLKHNGHWDPVTRQPINPSQVVKNLAVKAVIEDFLRENPWAYGK
mmetsp:Transcript_31025/g.99515  ORF Transcript_31025/g.99515 Transcript_31025/m.99515 type:complete len:268 (+) Transcript_31025:72-875(+)